MNAGGSAPEGDGGHGGQGPEPVPAPRRGRRAWSSAALTAPASAGPRDERLLEEVRGRAAAGNGRLSGADLAGAVRSSGLAVGRGSAQRAVRRLQEDLHGLGPLQAFADEPGTTDVLVDGSGAVWVDGTGGLRPTGIRLADPDEVRALAVRLAAAGGRRLDDAVPFADVVLGRYRIHTVLPPVSTGGPLVSVRIRHPGGMALEQALPDGAADAWFGPLRSVVAARLNFLVSGGTGSGKTTLLGAMLSAADPAERLLLVEDAQELAPEHPHVVGIQCRTGNVEGAGQVTLTDLVRQALRMRPDRLVVGECRGAEVREFLGAMNTGHDGAGGTIHASSAGAVPARLAAMGALSGMGPEAVALQAASALDLVVHMARLRGRRMPVEIGRLVHRSDAAGGGEGRGAGHGAEKGPAAVGLAVVTVARRTSDGRVELGPAAEWFRHALAERSVPPPW